MCYAALVAADLRRLERELGSRIDFAAFQRAYELRLGDPKAFKLPIALDRQFLNMDDPAAAAIATAISAYRNQRTTEWQAEIFEQRRRHADAERKLAQKVTKAAQKDLQVSADKIEQRLKWLSDFRDAAMTEEDAVMYPMHYGPLIIESDGELKIRPMRYHCRLPGHAPEMDKRLMGNYNARIDSLEDWWRPVFGKYHGLLVLDGFRENVKLHDMQNRELKEGERPENVVLQFNPKDATSMFVPCIWARWQRGDETLHSMALITDEPPPEVQSAGHNRCPINLTREAALAWLAPHGRSSAELFEVLGQRHRPYYEHRIAEAA
ncbi:SOS response-associated peptidase family protein [Steroidobacter agaridevorans]|uniref:SOS response-associated peptidase family protein n=1 Tax=Steroidobacter agaridevorans TaxID=2695856 RepID=UPI001AD91C87|nr:SOS response-associated peptidase family protein [Steroidobacter agaridevorans]